MLVGYFKGGVVTSDSTLNRIDRIPIPPSYNFFSESPTIKNPGARHD
jgi:hypothetical protein